MRKTCWSTSMDVPNKDNGYDGILPCELIHHGKNSSMYGHQNFCHSTSMPSMINSHHLLISSYGARQTLDCANSVTIATAHCFTSRMAVIGRKLRTFTQLKRNKRFDNFIMFGMGPRITISYCCRVTSCTGSLGVTRLFVHGSNSKVASMLSRTIPTDSSCYNDSEKVQFDLSTTYRFVVIEGKVKGQFFGSTGVKQAKMVQFCWQWSQSAHLVNTMKNQNSLPYVRCIVTMVTQQKRSANGH